jgi:hypothetical protein
MLNVYIRVFLSRKLPKNMNSAFWEEAGNDWASKRLAGGRWGSNIYLPGHTLTRSKIILLIKFASDRLS